MLRSASLRPAIHSRARVLPASIVGASRYGVRRTGATAEKVLIVDYKAKPHRPTYLLMRMPCQHSLPRRIIVLGRYGAKQFAQNVAELQRNSGLRYKFLISRVSECRRAATSFGDEGFGARWLMGVTATTGNYAGNVKTNLQRFLDTDSRRRALEPKILGLCLSVCSLSVRERTHPNHAVTIIGCYHT